MNETLSRRRVLALFGASSVLPWLGSFRPAPRITVDFGNSIGRTGASALGYGVTTYVRTAIDSPALAAAETRLDGRYVRIPVRLKDGSVTSGASGGPKNLDASPLIRWYQKRNCRVLVVIAGVTTDVDVQPGDTAALIRRLIAAGVDIGSLEISSPNEPNNQKLTLDQSIALAKVCSDEVRQVVPDKRLWGPAWTWYDRDALREFAQAMGDRLAGIDFHHYAMGVSSLSTAEALSQTSTWGKEVSDVRSDLKALSLPDQVSVSELNFSWRFQDGTPPSGSNQRFFTAVNTVWCASVIGHILQAGGSAAIYGNQNGALGVWSEDAEATPMPAFWGLAAWTGAHLFPHFGGSMYEVQSSFGVDVEAFAVDNEAGGRNVVLINKSETAALPVDVTLLGFSVRSLAIWQSDPDKPQAPLRRLVGPQLGSLLLPKMSVTTVVVS